jgi:hypothetical protein
MQNKANLLDTQMNVTYVKIKNYAQKTMNCEPTKQTQTKPISIPKKLYSSMASKLLVVWAVGSEWAVSRRAFFRAGLRQRSAVKKSEGFDAGGFGDPVFMLQASLKGLDGKFVHPAFHSSQAIGGGLFGCSFIAPEQGLCENRQAVFLFVRQINRGNSGG